MGIRPHAYLICGVNDVQTKNLEIVDPRYTPVNDLPWVDLMEESPPLPDLITETDSDEAWERSMDNTLIRATLENQDGSILRGYELIAFDTEFGVPTAMGYIVSEAPYDHDVTWAIASIYPELKESKVIPIPTYTKTMTRAVDSGRRWFRHCSKNMPHIERVEYDGQTYTRQAWPDMEFGRYAELAELRKTNSRVNYNIRDLIRHVKAIKNGQVPHTFYHGMEGYLTVAHYVLNWAGMKIDREELRLYLYFQWS